jgi:lipid-A-disaccharide synthase
MKEAGVDLLFDAGRIAVTGIVEVAGALGPILKAWRSARSHLRNATPDLVLLVDYPDFNLRFARLARRAGVPVAYFVSPQVWAWRRYRVRRIARDVDRMLVLFPFETAFYRDAGVRVEFVGHPLVDLVHPEGERSDLAASLGLDPSVPVLGLLPGSRRSEVRRLLPVMLEAATILGVRFPGLQCVLPVASTLDREVLEGLIASSPAPVTPVQGSFYRGLGACTAALVSSGTATLETALLGVPLVVTYRLSPWTYHLARRLSGLENVGLPNLVLGRRAVPECIQDECRGDRLAEAVAPFLRDTEERREAVAALSEVRERLGDGGAFRRAAAAVADMLAGRAATPDSTP